MGYQAQNEQDSARQDVSGEGPLVGPPEVAFEERKRGRSSFLQEIGRSGKFAFPEIATRAGVVPLRMPRPVLSHRPASTCPHYILLISAKLHLRLAQRLALRPHPKTS